MEGVCSPHGGQAHAKDLNQGCRGSDFNARVLGGRVSLQCLGARGQGMVLQEMTAWLGMKNTEELDVQGRERGGGFRQREPCKQRHKAREARGCGGTAGSEST